MLPIILVAPHASSVIPEPLRGRYALDDKEIWQCSDRFTDELNEFTCLYAKHAAEVNRLVCDMNRAPNAQDAFREFDFYGKRVFNDGKEFTLNEKENLLMQYWYPFHQEIVHSIQGLDEEGAEVILLVDYHNTAGDHALNINNDYMASMILSNLGSEDAYENQEGVSIPYNYLFELQDFIGEALGISAEINRIYHGGYNLYWYTHLKNILNLKAKIYAIQIEYNLDYVFNPISKIFDRKALEIMQKTLNEGLASMYENILVQEGTSHNKEARISY
ncbi:N-formylglutamate amidohydrolase [Candidatus Peregrinibacteria bacterium]|nr:N-formylglutamate amidohydrolase [Candidatus Peregrinibacteria bacterium]